MILCSRYTYTHIYIYFNVYLSIYLSVYLPTLQRTLTCPTPPQPFSYVSLQHVCTLQRTLTCPTPPQPFSYVALQHVCTLQRTLTCPTPPQPFSYVALQHVCTLQRTLTNPTPPQPFSYVALQHVCTLQRTLTCPTPPQPFSYVALQHVCTLQRTLTCPTPKITTLVGAASHRPTKTSKPQQKATHMIRFCCPQASFSVTLASGCDKASRNRCTPLAGKRGGKQLANCCLKFETLMFLDKIKTNGKPLALFKHFCIFLQYLRTLVRRKELVGAQITLITIRRGSLAFPLDRFAPPMPT